MITALTPSFSKVSDFLSSAVPSLVTRSAKGNAPVPAPLVRRLGQFNNTLYGGRYCIRLGNPQNWRPKEAACDPTHGHMWVQPLTWDIWTRWPRHCCPKHLRERLKGHLNQGRVRDRTSPWQDLLPDFSREASRAPEDTYLLTSRDLVFPVRICLGGREYLGVVDTGATISIVTKTILPRGDLRNIMPTASFRMGDGHVVHSCGDCGVNVPMGSRSIAHRFWVKDTKADFVLGTSFVVEHSKILSVKPQAPFVF